MSGEKTFDATDHKVEEARKDGNVAISQDLMKSTVCVVGFEACRALVIAYYDFGAAYFQEFIGQLVSVHDHASFRADNIAMWVGGSILLSVLIGCTSIVVFVVMSWLQTGGPVIKKEPIAFKLESLHPKNYFGKVFSAKSAVDIGTNVLKAFLISLTLWSAVREVIQQMPLAVPAGMAAVSSLVAREAMGAVRSALVLLLVMGIADFWLQRRLMLRDLKMSFQDVKDEHKQMEGSPETKHNIRSFAEQLLQGGEEKKNQLEGANVLVVNPTHVAVGLRYVHGERQLPRIRSTAIDFAAMQLIELARDTGVPVVRHIWLARTLYNVKPDAPIPKEAYRAIAAIYRLILGLDAVRPN